MRDYLQKIATGPQLSKSLDRTEAADAMRTILDPSADEVQAAIFLIAMRMKRETDEENAGMLDALLESVVRAPVDCEMLLAIADPFNGMARGIPATPFLAPTLAACGVNAYSHGLRSVAPKYGITHHAIYAAAGIAVDLSPAEVARQIADKNIGWGYVDQSRYCEKLHRLIDLRARIVKRTCLATLEVMLGPLRAAQNPTQNHVMTGFVHNAYPPVYCRLARQAGYDGAIIVRGVEGGCLPALNQVSRFFHYRGDRNDGGEFEVRIAPAQVNIKCNDRAIPLPTDKTGGAFDVAHYAADAVKLGMQALDGQGGAMRDSLIYGGAIGLWHCNRATDLADGAAQVRDALDSGAALARFTAAQA